MARTGRPGISAEQKNELWQRWKAGDTLSDIGRALGKHAGSIFGVLVAKGGIAAATRIRRANALSVAEREEIARGLAVGSSIRQLARELGRAPSTICREVSRNGGARRYRPSLAEERASMRALRPKPCRLASCPELCALVADRLENRWSPQQVSGWLKATHPGRREMQLSHETIYRSLFVQARGVLNKELLAHLRSRRVMRLGKMATTAGQTRGQIIGAVSIRERPAEIEDRAVPGHWEGDLLSGARNSHIAALVERQSRFVMLVRVGGKDGESVIDTLVGQVRLLPEGLMASLTWDRGTELAYHRRFTLATGRSLLLRSAKSLATWQ